MTVDKAIERIRKLMALTAARGANENEATMAAEHVQRLLAEYNLSMSSIELAGGTTGEGGKRGKERVGRRQVYKWQRKLMATLAEQNYCKSFIRWTGRKFEVFDGYDLIGRVDNVITTTVMFEYLLQTIERLAREEMCFDATRYFTREAHSFKEGISDRVRERLRDQREEMIREQDVKKREAEARAKHPGAAVENLPMVLSDVVQSEEDLNRDFERGVEPGTTARERAEQQAKSREYQEKTEAKQAALILAGESEDMAYYLARDYERETAERLTMRSPPEKVRPMTEKQRQAKEAQDERQRKRWEQSRERQEEREFNRLDRGAYSQGRKAGDTVSLNKQVDKPNEKRRLS